ncbi:MAG TPA: MaoC family dehydratase [Stellaceae bacterium]|nr:MaoC family dehydratase [Stellaceae bacterium]
MSDRYFDDFALGERFTTRGVTLTEGMIIDFAMAYDPQPFHTDVESARESNYGGLIASGFQTLVLGFRTVIDTGIFRASSMGSPGFDELRWLRPVRPGDTLHTDLEVVEKKPSSSKPDRGILRIAYRIKNQKGEEVLTFLSMHLLRRRPGVPAP